MKKWDNTEQHYIFDHGWRLDAEETLILSREQFAKYQYTGRSITDSKTRTIMLPSDHGCSLIFEGKHFRVV